MLHFKLIIINKIRHEKENKIECRKRNFLLLQQIDLILFFFKSNFIN